MVRMNEAHALSSPFLHTLFYILTDRVVAEIQIRVGVDSQESFYVAELK